MKNSCSYFVGILLFFSCSTPEAPRNSDPESRTLDSLWTLYEAHIPMAKPEYLGFFTLDPKGNTLLYGGLGKEFWLGIFRPDLSLIRDHLFTPDGSQTFIKPITKPQAVTFQVLDQMVFELYTQPLSPKADTIVRTIAALNLDSYELGKVHDLMSRNELDVLDYVRPWKGSFLMEHSGIISKNGKNYTQAISYDFTERIRWECRAPESPRIGVYYFDVDFFLDVTENSVSGFDYSTCKKWGYNTLDFFGKSSCPGCQSSILLKQQVGPEITLEASLNGEVRRIVMEYRTGRIVKNEVV